MSELIAKDSYHGTGCPVYELQKIGNQYLILAEYWGNEHHCWLFEDEFTAMECFKHMCDNDALMNGKSEDC